jgi:hypothetical protein
MSLEKRFAAVSAQVFTANGGTNGSISIADTRLFKVKQHVVISATGQINLELEVKKVIGPTSMIVGPITGSINTFTDLSAYTTATTASVFANEQRRPTITADDFERAVYEEEPIVAKRVILVDEFGNKYDTENPLPTDATLVGQTASTNAVTSVSASTSNQTLLAANTSRIGATVYNDSSEILYLKLGVIASTTSFTVQMESKTYYETPYGYTGQIDGLWANAVGAARIGELT